MSLRSRVLLLVVCQEERTRRTSVRLIPSGSLPAKVLSPPIIPNSRKQKPPVMSAVALTSNALLPGCWSIVIRTVSPGFTSTASCMVYKSPATGNSVVLRRSEKSGKKNNGKILSAVSRQSDSEVRRRGLQKSRDDKQESLRC